MFVFDLPKRLLEDNDKWYHLGKRSAAGRYCYDCQQTLAYRETDSGWKWADNKVIHTMSTNHSEKCLRCEKVLDYEVSQRKKSEGIREGVMLVSSFTIRLRFHELINFYNSVKNTVVEDFLLVEVEGCAELTLQGFIDELAECPVQFVNEQLGEWS